MHSRAHAFLMHPLAASSLASWQPGFPTSCQLAVRNFRDFSVFSPQKLFGGPSPHFGMALETPFSPYRLVKFHENPFSRSRERLSHIFDGRKKNKTKNKKQKKHLQNIYAFAPPNGADT